MNNNEILETKIIELKNFIGDSQGILEIKRINSLSSIILIVPGGGYEHFSIRENKPVENKFNELGYNTAVLKYSLAPKYNYKTFTLEIEETMKILSKSYKNLFMLGFSAGGHLVGIGITGKYKNLCKGAIFCYSVLSLDHYTNEGTSHCFLGVDDNPINRKNYSIENRIDENTPPCFVWSMKNDLAVPYKNSERFVTYLNKNNVKNTFILFENGKHGIALADETSRLNGDNTYIDSQIANWPILVDNFIKEILKNE